MPHCETQLLISASRNLHLGDCTFDRDLLAPDCPTPWFVRMMRLHGGKQAGVDVITLDNGKIRLRLCPTRGMGILDVQMGPLRLGWDSPVKEVVHPMFVDLQRRGRTGWLEGFGEFLVRCGLEFLGPPCDDKHHQAVGEPPAADITLHGKIANIPASEVEIEVQTAAPFAITLRAVVHERSMYGPKLALTTELTLIPGQPSFTLTDTIRNLGGQTQEACLLYHINQGKPILEEGTQLHANILACTPRDPGYPDADIQNFNLFGKPTPASTEQAFFIDLKPNPQGRAAVLLHNPHKALALGVSWPKQQLPLFTLWKALHDERDGYVTGLEPCTTYPLPRPAERNSGHLLQLKPSQSHTAQLTFNLYDHPQAIQQAIQSL